MKKALLVELSAVFLQVLHKVIIQGKGEEKRMKHRKDELIGHA